MTSSRSPMSASSVSRLIVCDRRELGHLGAQKFRPSPVVVSE
jgi:hypothetical protein